MGTYGFNAFRHRMGRTPRACFENETISPACNVSRGEAMWVSFRNSPSDRSWMLLGCQGDCSIPFPLWLSKLLDPSKSTFPGKRRKTNRVKDPFFHIPFEYIMIFKKRSVCAQCDMLITAIHQPELRIPKKTFITCKVSSHFVMSLQFAQIRYVPK